jgi:acetylornithine deacetylase/succinyl-diaminopimelate desuccinylase-like protein
MKPRHRRLAAYVDTVRSRFEDWLGQLVEIPSISMDPEHRSDIRRTAKLAAQLLRALGAQAAIVETDGNPVVSGGWHTGTRNPTLTIYNHLDVQPAQEPEWRRPPFAFRIEDGRYLGRGATDDKGPALAALLGAHYALEQGVPLNVRVLWELEEEVGSPHFADALRNRQAVPKPDSVVVSDTIWIAKGRPAMSTGLRGLLCARLSLRTASVGAHSGLTGGAARNPLAELCALVEACVEPRTGRVKIPGFYDQVVPPTKRELREFLASGFDVRRFMRAYGFHSLRAMSAAEVMKRIWTAPTFEVHGLAGGYQGPGVKTVVPPAGELKVSMRLVPDQRPERIFSLFRRFVTRINPHVRVEPDGMLEPFRGVVTGPYADALRRAMRAGFGKDPVAVREGGSIGAVATMHRFWNVPILFLGLSLPEHGYHAPNEFFDWGQAAGGIKAFAAYCEEVAKIVDR